MFVVDNHWLSSRAFTMSLINNKTVITSYSIHYTKLYDTLFGAGWAWLVKNADGSLAIVKESNAGNPLRDGLTPILTCDVWEHAYYLDKQNARPKYIEDFWKIIDWSVVGARY